MEIKIDGPEPIRMTPGSAGYDLRTQVDFVLESTCTHTVNCCLKIEIPEGYVGLICPRSGLASQGITVLNAPGVIDSDYRGEVKVILANLSAHRHQFLGGDRVAQLLIVPITAVTWVHCTNLSKTTRGSRGFGSTGGS